jgi:hypothetical protein
VPFGSITSMRTFSPCWKVLTVLTGVPKSTTSGGARQAVGQCGLQELDDDVLALLADVDPGAGV